MAATPDVRQHFFAKFRVAAFFGVVVIAIVITVMATTATAAATASEDSEARALQALRRGGHIIVLRHAVTVPGVGDPPGYRLDDCTTQRNLSVAGRAEAGKIGEYFSRAGVAIGQVFSSRWCRCRDTAQLAFGKVESWSALDSHFDFPSRAAAQAAQVREQLPARMARLKPGENLVLMTHQVNISQLTGVTPATGEAIIAALPSRAGDPLVVVGNIASPASNAAPAK